MDLEELLEFRKTELTNLLLAGNTMRRLTSMNHRKVGLRLHIVYCDTSFLNIISVSSLSLYCPLDYKKGFGGSFGIQKDRVDKSAHGWEHVENLDKHASQKGERLVKVQ